MFYLSLGSNMGDRAAHLKKALHFLQGIGNIPKISSLYETDPVDMEPGATAFYNIVLCLQVSPPLDPLDLLGQIKAFESSMGRDIRNSHLRPRVIDIDILLAGDLVLETPELVIPHKEMTKRGFVLIPLNEIAPDLVHPLLQKPIKEILSSLL